MSTDRNLLVGILAVQMNFIRGDELIQAMNHWVLEKHLSLSSILTKHQILSTTRAALLDAVVDEHLKAHGEDARQCLLTLSHNGAMPAALQQINDEEVQQSVQSISNATKHQTGEETVGLEISHPAGLSPKPTDTDQRYRILRPHAKGGLGEIFVAEDLEVRREVALKEIQNQYADNVNSRGRFILEGEVTGRLEHPNIVPVYGMGLYPDGRPFYVMRFIRGKTLKEAIDDYYQLPTTYVSERNVQFRELLKRFTDVCHAVAYAHSRKILHRDIKPANIMLGKFGETFVVDWGLAKSTSTGQAMPSSEHSVSERTIIPVTGSYAETQDGSAIGTPAFMSPEQAAGRLEDVTEKSDVYSLGATLYCLATGRIPFKATDVDIISKVEKGEFPQPADVNADIAPALNAIILKAMAKNPEHRYASVEDLAKEVDLFLADEAVEAYRDPMKVRIKRWAKKYPGLSGALLSSAIFLIFGTGYGLAVLSAAYSIDLSKIFSGNSKSGKHAPPNTTKPPTAKTAAPPPRTIDKNTNSAKPASDGRKPGAPKFVPKKEENGPPAKTVPDPGETVPYKQK